MESYEMTEKPPYYDIGQRIKEARISTGHNQPSMTKVLGLNEPVYGNYERGRNRMPPNIMDKFVQITGYSADWLYLGIEPKLLLKKEGLGEKLQSGYETAPDHIQKTIRTLLGLEE